MGMTTASVGALCLALALLPATTASAQTRAFTPSQEQINQARRHFQAGVELYRQGNGHDAVVEMRKAYQIAPSPRLLFNIGQAALEAHDYAVAFDSLTGYLNSNSADLTEPRRREIVKELEELRQRVGFITVQTNIANAQVVLDGIAVPDDHVGPITVQSGRHEVTLLTKDGPALTHNVDVSARDATVLRLYSAEAPSVRTEPSASIPPRAQPPVLSPPRPSTTRLLQRRAEPSAAEASSLRPWAWVGVATTVGFGGTTIASALLTSRTERNHQALIQSPRRDPEEVSASERRVHNAQLTTNIFLGLTTVAALSAATLFYLDGRAEPASAQRARPRLQLQALPGQLRLHGTF